MTPPSQPPTPEPTVGPGFAIFIVLVISLMIGGIGAAVFGGADDEPAPEESLCSLLRDGWTGDQLASNDVWQDWPTSQSPLSRGIEIVGAAERGGCVKLV